MQNLMAEKPQPVKVLYCAVCSLPAEYCEFGPDFEKCKPWLIKNAPDLYPDLLKGKKKKRKGKDLKTNSGPYVALIFLSQFMSGCWRNPGDRVGKFSLENTQGTHDM